MIFTPGSLFDLLQKAYLKMLDTLYFLHVPFYGKWQTLKDFKVSRHVLP